jgi:hypothetical protein
MAQTPHPVSTAFWTYVIPMMSTRAMRIGVVLFVGFVAVIVLLFMSGLVSEGFVSDALLGARYFLVMVAVPVGAVLLSEIPIRDGITHKTLLYPLLGPVPRVTHAVVRLVTTSAVLAIGAAALLLLIRILLKDGFGALSYELLGVTLGAFAYVSLFGFLHVLIRRGLITGVVILFAFDIPLGKLPFSLRNLSPSYHVGVITDQQVSMQLPISFGVPDTSLTVSIIVLVAIAVLFSVATAVLFKRKDLGELC